jgi:hypothetical protein
MMTNAISTLVLITAMIFAGTIVLWGVWFAGFAWDTRITRRRAA